MSPVDPMVDDDEADDWELRTEWAAVVTYPADRGGRFAGQTWILGAGTDMTQQRAEQRARWHRTNGATEAYAAFRVWTPGQWTRNPSPEPTTMES